GQITFTIHSDAHKPDEFTGKDIPEKHKEEAAKRFPATTTFTVDLPEGFKQQNTTFDRFGLMNAMKPGGHLRIYFDNLTVNGQSEDFSSAPRWVGVRNRETSRPADASGVQNFGYETTQLAGGEKAGEIGGTFWRTEGPVAFYADR